MNLRVTLFGAISAATIVTNVLAADLAGTWAVSSTIIAHGHVVGTATPICKFSQAGNQLTGFCKGPNARGPASGIVDGAGLAWQWSTSATTAVGLSGVQSFRGRIYPDGVIRGTSRSSNLPGRGTFTAQRL
jgi:hypothetical protein